MRKRIIILLMGISKNLQTYMSLRGGYKHPAIAGNETVGRLSPCPSPKERELSPFGGVGGGFFEIASCLTMTRFFFSILLIVLLSISTLQNVKAQDPHFSQFYATPLFQNPAFTGTRNQHRFIIDYRNQWPSISKAFVSQLFSYDYNLSEYNSGIGLLIVNDKAGSEGLKHINFGLLYSYKVQITEAVSVRAGIHASYSIMDIDFSRLIFNDQLYNKNIVSFENLSDNKVKYLDISSGGLLYSEKFWIGSSLYHLNKPNQSLIIKGSSVLPIKISVHGGYKIPIYYGDAKKARKSISPAFNYRTQGEFNQLDMGCYFSHEPLVIGLWYRGIPVPKSKLNTNDAVTILAGYTIANPNIKIGYSYDLTVSQLITKSGGAHEISLIYEIINEHKKKKFPISCPTF